MEAVPRMPMLSFELKQSPEYVDFGPVLKQYIRDHYGEDPAHYNKACTDLEQLRQSAVHVSQDFMGCSTLKKYYAQLQYLQGRFPMGEGGEAAIPFTWEDIHMGREITLADIKFEQASVLYNIGALHSVLGTMETRQNADGMKVSCTHFQCASWAFEYLRDHYGCAVMSSDMSHDLLTFQVNLMLAQAQECILEKSMIDSRKSTITAKVAAQIVDFYNIAIKNLDVCNEEGLVSSRRHKDWKKRMEIKILFYKCITNYYMGRQSEDQQKWGECLAYYTQANTKLQECIKAAKNESSDIQESLRFANDVVGGKYQSAKKDNDFVYHEKIPAIDTLPEVKGASLVKGIPFNPNDPEVSGPDIFQKLVPMEAHEASSLYSEEKAKLLRKVGSDIEEKNQELSQFMSSLQLDPSKLDYEPERLPQQLLEKCAAISVRTNAIKDLVESMGAVSNVATEVDMAIQEINQLLENEKKEDEEFQAQFGKKSPNTMLTQIKKECDLYEEGHKKGSQSNNDLHKAMNAHIINLKLLAGPLEDLQKALPSMDQQKSPEDEAIARELQRILNKVEEMKQQRVMLEEQFRGKVRDDDITNVIVTQEGSNKQTIFDEQLKKHDQVVGYIHQNLAAQDNILQALTSANAKYANMRRLTHDTSSKRESMIRDLINSYDVYEDLLLKSKKGLEFYKKLESNTNRLLDRCKGLCKIQYEEREQILNRLKPKAPPPTRPMAPKPGNEITGEKLPDLASQAVPEQNLPVPGTQPFLPSEVPQLPSVIPAGFDGPKLKDYLPFMKPKTFGKDRKTRSKEPSPQPYDDSGAYGSLPTGGVSSPVHLPSGPSSLPGSPHHGRVTADTGYTPQYSPAMRPDTGQTVYKPADAQNYPSPSQSPGLQFPSPAQLPSLAAKPEQTQTLHQQNIAPQGLQHPHSKIQPNNSVPGPSEQQYQSSYDRTKYSQQIPSSDIQSHSMVNMMGRKEQDGIMSSHGQPYTAHQYTTTYTQPGTQYIQQTEGGSKMPFHGNMPQQPYGATNTVSAANTPIITPGNAQSYHPHGPSMNKQSAQLETDYKTNSGVSTALAQNYTPAMTSSGAFTSSMPCSVGHQQHISTYTTSAGYTSMYGSPGMLGYTGQQGTLNQNQQMTQHPTFSQQQQPKTGNLPHQVSNQQYQMPNQQIPPQQQNLSSQQGPQPLASQQAPGVYYTHQQQASGQVPTQQAPQGYGNQFDYQQTPVSQQMGQPQSFQQSYTVHSQPSQQPLSQPTKPVIQGDRMPTSFQHSQQHSNQINQSTYQQQQATVPQQPVQTHHMIQPQQSVQQPDQTLQQQPSMQPHQNIQQPVQLQQHFKPQQVQQLQQPPNQQQVMPSQQIMAHQSYQQQRPSQIPTQNIQGNQLGAFIQQQEVQVSTSQAGMAQYPGQQQIRPNVTTSQAQGVIQPQTLQQAQRPLYQQTGNNQIPQQFVGQLQTQQQQNQNQQIHKQLGQQAQQPGYSSQQQLSSIQPNIGQQSFGQQPQQYQQQQQPVQGMQYSQGISSQQQYQQRQQLTQTSQHQVVAGNQPSLYQQNMQPQQGQGGYHQHQQSQGLNSAQQIQNQSGYQFPQVNIQGQQYPSQPYQGQSSGLQGQLQGQSYQQSGGQQSQQTQRTQVPGNLPTQQWSSSQQCQTATQQNIPVSQQPQSYPQQTNPLSPDLLPQPILPSPIKPSSVKPESVEEFQSIQPSSLPNQDNSQTGIYQQPQDNQPSPAKTERKIQSVTRPEASVSPKPKLQRQHSGTSTSSSLDDILSSSPDGPRNVVNNSMLTPKVLTAQEIQQQKEEALMKNSLSRQMSKDPYADVSVRDKFVAEVEKLAKVVESLTKTTCSGPTQLDTLWKELIDEQEKAGRKQCMAIARCYPMKNRETDVMPYDETRVLLTHHKDDYINASYINDLSPSCPKFIATQMPLPTTLVDFWVMVYEQGAEVIVMLSSDTATGKMYPEYWPNQKGQVIHHGPITLNLQSVKDKQFWVERIIYLNHVETKQGRTIVQLQYKQWPVSGFPDKVSYVLQFITEVHSFYRQQRSLLKPVVVHCSTGIGRTGTFLMIYTGMQEIDHGNGIISIQEVAKKMILRRRNAIREKSQLKYCYDAILFYAQDVLATRGILIRKASFGDRIPHPGEKSNQWTPSEDVVFGSMSINTLQSSLSNLHAKNVENTRDSLEKTKIQDKIIGETDLHKNTVSKFSSLPDVVQRADCTSQMQLIDTTESSQLEVKPETSKTTTGSMESLTKIGAPKIATGSMESLTKIGAPKIATGSMESLTKIGSPKMGSRSGSNASLLSDGSVGSGSTPLEGSPFHKQHVPQAPDVPQCLADLQDPKTFTLGKESGKKKISKKDFSTKSSMLHEQSDKSDDPLNSLDPLWSLNKGQK